MLQFKCPKHREKDQNDPNLKADEAIDGPDRRTVGRLTVHPVSCRLSSVADLRTTPTVHGPTLGPWVASVGGTCRFLQSLLFAPFESGVLHYLPLWNIHPRMKSKLDEYGGKELQSLPLSTRN
uniref:Uncharacterized protein n=1 Tax=Solanum tuberosum TaxID=4113 RepID=M1DQ10_SOLTU